MCDIIWAATKLNVHADEDMDRMGNYEPNMPVSIHEDGADLGRRCHKARWMNEIRTFPAIGNKGSNIVQIPFPHEECANPEAFCCCLHEGGKVLEHTVTYQIKHVAGTIEVAAKSVKNQSWKRKVSGEPMEVMLPLTVVQKVGKAVGTTLVLEVPLKEDITSINLTNDPAMFPNKMYITRLPGIPVATLKDIIEPQYHDDNGIVTWVKGPDGPNTVKKVYRKRGWTFVAPQAVMDILLSTGEILLTRAEAAKYIRRIMDNAQHPGL